MTGVQTCALPISGDERDQGPEGDVLAGAGRFSTVLAGFQQLRGWQHVDSIQLVVTCCAGSQTHERVAKIVNACYS